MASYTVTLRADKQQYPVLLSNGNLVEQGDAGRRPPLRQVGRPFRKPSYLFALVAGPAGVPRAAHRLAQRQGAPAAGLRAPGDLDKTEHAMNSLMASVAWDEARFGLPLDLERFMIVATSDFNMGAMENKGLNIFNTKYVWPTRPRPPTPTTPTSSRWSATSTSTTGPATASPAATGSSCR
jgi:aminopeptidase N